jgi:hypothetical protein
MIGLMYTCLRKESTKSLIGLSGFALLSKISIRLEGTDASVTLATAHIENPRAAFAHLNTVFEAVQL